MDLPVLTTMLESVICHVWKIHFYLILMLSTYGIIFLILQSKAWRNIFFFLKQFSLWYFIAVVLQSSMGNSARISPSLLLQFSSWPAGAVKMGKVAGEGLQRANSAKGRGGLF